MIWSTPMWNLYHTLCEKCEDSKEKRQKVYELIQKLSIAIPCGICKVHAVSYLNTKKKNSIFKSREAFKMFFYDFHNDVKKTRKLSLEPEKVLDNYKSMDLNLIYREVIEMLILFGMPNDFTTKINDLYIESFDNLEGAKNINREYVKDPHNTKRILTRLGIKTKKINKKHIDPMDKTSNSKTKECNSKPTFGNTLKLLLVGGGLLATKSKKIFKKK
jgi:hypothetical protein